MVKHTKPIKKPPSWIEFLDGLAKEGNLDALEGFLEYFQAHRSRGYQYLTNYTKCCMDKILAARKVGLPVV